MGVEPTHPPWQGGRQPLHHGRDKARASGGDRTRDTTVGRQHVAATPRTQLTSGSGGDRTHIDLFKRQVPSQCRPHFHFSERGTWNAECASENQNQQKTRPIVFSSFRVPRSQFRVQKSGSGEESNPAGIKPSVLETEHAPRREALPVWFFTFLRSAFRVPSSTFKEYPVAVTIRLQLPEKQWS